MLSERQRKPTNVVHHLIHVALTKVIAIQKVNVVVTWFAVKTIVNSLSQQMLIAVQVILLWLVLDTAC